MRNSDVVKFVGFSCGGVGTTGFKVRFAVDSDRRTKVLTKIGASAISWLQLPKDMNKSEAVTYLSQNATTPTFSQKVYQDAIAKAVKRLTPQAPAAKTTKNTK